MKRKYKIIMAFIPLIGGLFLLLEGSFGLYYTFTNNKKIYNNFFYGELSIIFPIIGLYQGIMSSLFINNLL